MLPQESLKVSLKMDVLTIRLDVQNQSKTRVTSVKQRIQPIPAEKDLKAEYTI